MKKKLYCKDCFHLIVSIHGHKCAVDKKSCSNKNTLVKPCEDFTHKYEEDKNES